MPLKLEKYIFPLGLAPINVEHANLYLSHVICSHMQQETLRVQGF